MFQGLSCTDNGWANRRSRSSGNTPYGHTHSHARQDGPAVGSGPRAENFSGYGWAPQLAPPPAPPVGAWRLDAPNVDGPARGVQPSHASAPMTTTSSLPTFQGQYDAPSTAAPAPLPEIPQKERKLEFLLRTIDERLVTRKTSGVERWEPHDTNLLKQLIEEHRKVGADGTMRMRTMRTALAYYVVLMDCRQAEQIDPTPEEILDALRLGIRDIVFDLCEDYERDSRKEAYRALLDLSSKDPSLALNNCSVLVQLLQNSDDDDELELVREMLAKHVELSMSSDFPALTLTACLQVVINDFGDLRRQVFDFLSSCSGRRIVESIIGDCIRESILARHLALVLPAAEEEEYPRILDLLHMLQDVWPDADSLSAEEKAATKEGGTALLWNLCRVLMSKSKTYVFAAAGDDGAHCLSSRSIDRLVDTSSECSSSVILHGGAVFNHATKVLADMAPTGVDEVTTSSDAKLFLDKLAMSTRYLFCYLPPEGSDTVKNTALKHFSPAQRIALFRSMANLAARVASAARKAPTVLNFGGETLAKDIALVSIRALLTHVPVAGSTTQSSNDGRAGSGESDGQDAYTILAAEALLTAIDQCESYLSSVSRNPTTLFEKDEARDRVRSLNTLARALNDKGTAMEEVLEAAKVVLSLSQEYSQQLRSGHKCLAPKWMQAPPLFPHWKASMPETAATEKETKNSARKRKESVDVPIFERRVRGRGNVHFSSDGAELAPSPLTSAIPCRPAAAHDAATASHSSSAPPRGPAAARPTEVPREAEWSSQASTGISIRGASQADHSSPALRYDSYRPGLAGLRADFPRSPTFGDRICGRSQPDLWPRPRYRDRDAPPAHDRFDARDEHRSRRRDEQDPHRSRPNSSRSGWDD